MLTQSRWIIPAGGAVQLVVRFRSSDVGAFAERLAFECVGGPRVETPRTQGGVRLPENFDEYRNVYYRKTKQRPAEKDVNHQFIVSRDPDARGRSSSVRSSTTANDRKPRRRGRGAGGRERRARARTGGSPRAGRAPSQDQRREASRHKQRSLRLRRDARSARLPVDEDGNPLVPGDDGIFTVEPESMRLAVDETRELFVFAYPKGDLPPEEEPAEGDAPNPMRRRG